MPVNVPKAYKFTPYFPKGKQPQIFTYESYRSRLEAGGTFFRTINTGAEGNQVSIEIINNDPNVTMNVRAPAKSSVTNFTGTGNGSIKSIQTTFQAVNETFTITATDPTTFSIVSNLSGNIGTVKTNKLFVYSYLSFIIIPGNVAFVAGDVFTLQVVEQLEVYTSANNPQPADPQSTVPSQAIIDIRALVNANSQYIQMTARGYDYVDSVGDDPQTGRTVRTNQSPPADANYMSAIPPTYLAQGQGFPTTPVGIFTGPDRALIHINRGENDDGTVKLINKIYEWSGDSASNGAFTVYN